MKDQPNNTLTNEQFNILAALLDAGIKATGISAISDNLPGAIQAFATFRPEEQNDKKPEKANE